MAIWPSDWNNTFQDTFINVLDDELNNLKDIHVNKMNINEIDEILPESEDISIEKLTKSSKNTSYLR